MCNKFLKAPVREFGTTFLQQLLISSHIDKLLPLAKSGSAHKVTFLEVHPFPLNLWWKSYFSNYLLIQPHCGDGLTTCKGQVDGMGWDWLQVVIMDPGFFHCPINISRLALKRSVWVSLTIRGLLNCSWKLYCWINYSMQRHFLLWRAKKLDIFICWIWNLERFLERARRRELLVHKICNKSTSSMAALNKEKGKCEFQWNLIPKEFKLCRKSAVLFARDLNRTCFFIYIQNVEKGDTNNTR